MRIVFHTIKNILLFVLFVIFFAALYLSIHGLPDALTRNIVKRIQIKGMVLTLDKIKLNVVEGLVATDVRCYRKKEIGCPLFEAEEVVFQFDPERWLKKETGVSRAIIKNGTVCFLIPGRTEPAPDKPVQYPNVLVFEKIYAILSLNQTRVIRVVDLTMDFLGMNVTGQGALALPAEHRQKPVSAVRPETGDVMGEVSVHTSHTSIRKLLSWFNRIRLRKSVNANVEFFIDFMDIRKLDIQTKIEARNLRMEQSCVGTWYAKVGIKGKTGQGIIDIKNCFEQGVWIEKAFCRFQFDDETFRVEQLDGIVGRDSRRGPFDLFLNYHWGTRRYAGRFSCGFDPHVLLVPLKTYNLLHASRHIEKFKFTHSPPDFTGDFNGMIDDHPHFQIKGLGQADHCCYNGVSNVLIKTGFSVDVSETNKSMELTPCRVVREEGSIQGGMSVNFTSQTIDFDAASTADPQAIAKMIGPFLENLTGRFRFEVPNTIMASGTAGYVDVEKNRIDVDIQAQRLGWKMLLTDQCSLDVRVTGDTVELTNIHAAVCGGTVEGSASVYPVQGETNRRYEVLAKVDDVDFGLLIRTMTGSQSEAYQGRFSADVCLEGEVGDSEGKTVTGRGCVEVFDGRLFQIPLFGGLSDILTTIVPGLSILLRQTDAKASIVIRDGKIHSDEILIEGDILSLKGKGDYSLDGELDFDAQVTLLRKHTLVGEVVQIVTLPVSKMLEFHLGGTLESPCWEPVYLPKELFFIFD